MFAVGLIVLMAILVALAYRVRMHEQVFTSFLYNVGDVFICYMLFNMFANAYVDNYQVFFPEPIARPVFDAGILFHAPSAIFAAVVVLVLYHVFGLTERILTAVWDRLPDDTEETTEEVTNA